MEKEPQKILDNVWVRFILIAFSVIVFFFLCYILRGPLISLFLAFIVAYIFNPAVNFFERLRWPFSRKRIQRGFGIAIVIICVLLSASGFLTYAIPKTVHGAYKLGSMVKERYPKYLNNLEVWIEKRGDKEFVQIVKPLLIELIKKTKQTDIKEPSKQEPKKTEFNNIKEQKDRETPSSQETSAKKENQLKKPLTEVVLDFKKYLPQAINFFMSVIKNIFYGTFGFFSILINFIIFSVVSIYLLKDFNVVTQKIKNMFPLPKRVYVMGLLSKVNHNLQNYLRRQLTICLIESLVFGIGLTIAKINLSFLIGFIGGFGNLIPYAGTGTGIILSSIIAFFEFHDFKHILYIIIIFGGMQLLESTVLTPRIMGKGLGLNPVIVILSILICSQLFGFLGLLLAIPIAATLKVFVDELISRYKSSKYYTG